MQPVPPVAVEGTPVRPVILEGLLVTPYLKEVGNGRSKIAYSLRAAGLGTPGRASRSQSSRFGGVIMGTDVSVSVHPDPETFRLVEFPDSEAGPFVSLRLGDVALLVSDPASADRVDHAGRPGRSVADRGGDSPTRRDRAGHPA